MWVKCVKATNADGIPPFAADLVEIPSGGWLIDTPGLRALSLWTSGHGIEKAFADVFALSEECRFRDCKHEDEPECAVQNAISTNTLSPLRLSSMKRLIAEEVALEEEQREREKASDRRGFRKPKNSLNCYYRSCRSRRTTVKECPKLLLY
jgi:ribosome biogenesis GTPase / thiamine phosphate phosphatase